jgi:lysophospholipase L1-like esterase
VAIAREVVDWPAIAAEPGSLRADGIHPTALGASRLADAVAAAVRRCAP